MHDRPQLLLLSSTRELSKRYFISILKYCFSPEPVRMLLDWCEIANINSISVRVGTSGEKSLLSSIKSVCCALFDVVGEKAWYPIVQNVSVLKFSSNCDLSYLLRCYLSFS